MKEPIETGTMVECCLGQFNNNKAIGYIASSEFCRDLYEDSHVVEYYLYNVDIAGSIVTIHDQFVKPFRVDVAIDGMISV